MIEIRELLPTDCQPISAAFAAQGWNKPVAQYERYWQESQRGERVVLVAFVESVFAGYVTIVWEPDYPPFREANIPEIVDFNVLLAFQRQGIGTVLLDTAEELISQRSQLAGIGVGLMSDYGKAQILYVKRGYVPDGRGIFAHGRWLAYGDQLQVDDDVALYLTRKLGQSVED